MAKKQTITIYHNPRCSKSRQTLELIRQRMGEHAPTVIEYLHTPPSAEELGAILDLLGLEPRALMRKQEAPYAECHLDDPALSRAALIEAMVKHPILIERPIVIANGKAVIGRPPEKVLDIL